MATDQVRALLAGIRAADLVTAHEQGLVATYLPFVFDPDDGKHGSLITHVARNNRQWSEPTTGEALVIVHGADAYVSPDWLPSYADTAQAVPTWNYLTVHAYGELVAHDDPAWTEAAVRRLTEHHERLAGTTYGVDGTDAGYVERMLRAIVGIEIRLTRVEAKAKMSQNKRPDDVRGIVAGLASQPDDGSRASAAWMAEHAIAAAEARAAVVEDLAARARGARAPLA